MEMTIFHIIKYSSFDILDNNLYKILPEKILDRWINKIIDIAIDEFSNISEKCQECEIFYSAVTDYISGNIDYELLSECSVDLTKDISRNPHPSQEEILVLNIILSIDAMIENQMRGKFREMILESLDSIRYSSFLLCYPTSLNGSLIDQDYKDLYRENLIDLLKNFNE